MLAAAMTETTLGKTMGVLAVALAAVIRFWWLHGHAPDVGNV